MNILIAFFLFLISLNVGAHSIDLGYMEIEVNKETGIIKTVFDFNPKALGNPSQSFHNTLGKSFWKTGSSKCQWKNTFTEVISVDQIKVGADAVCPEIKPDLLLDLVFFRNFPDYRIFGRIVNDGTESTFVSTKNIRVVRITPVFNPSIGHFFSMGIRHIGTTSIFGFAPSGFKIPEGSDHLLFILALVVTGASFIQTFKMVMGFTIGHSISLVLATFGIITIPESLIGPAIAMSIIYVVIDGWFRKKYQHRFWLACGFGLIHGFGLASTLKGIALSGAKLMVALVGYITGVEIGQIIIISMIIPLFFIIKKYSKFYQQFQRCSALLVLIVGCYWFVDRIYSGPMAH